MARLLVGAPERYHETGLYDLAELTESLNLPFCCGYSMGARTALGLVPLSWYSIFYWKIGSPEFEVPSQNVRLVSSSRRFGGTSLREPLVDFIDFGRVPLFQTQKALSVAQQMK